MIVNNKNDIVRLRQSQLTDVKESLIETLQNIMVNPTELCNRKCGFCPRSDSKVYPNQNLHISEETVSRLSEQLSIIGFKNRLGWSGNGEPLLTKDFLKLVKLVSSKNPNISSHEINTNGDLLTERLVDEIYQSGINHIIVSVYDGQESLDKFSEMFSKYDVHSYTLRMSFNTVDPVGFTNRGGMVDVNRDKIKEFKDNKCFLPFYKLIIDWNGDVLVCCEDWGRKSKSELNINTHSLREIWFSEKLKRYRDRLSVGDRSMSPCNVCNVHGEKVGSGFVDKFYEK